MKVEVIRDEDRDRLSISEDEDFDGTPIAVLLYVPDPAQPDHEHIELNRQQATQLMSWLKSWLEETSK